jgi:hypothetical protein
LQAIFDFQIKFRITISESTVYGGLGFAQREGEKGQNCSVPLRSTPHFFQLVYTALFCAALFQGKTIPPKQHKKLLLKLLREQQPYHPRLTVTFIRKC